MLDTRAGFAMAILTFVLVSGILRGISMTYPPTRVFDEVYSPVFAWKFLRGEPFFDVHPLLAQLPQAVGLSLFGDTPLGWRFSAWLWGSLFVAGIGLFGAALTGQRIVGVLASLLSVLDIAFFVYGRTGLPDMFLLATFVWAMACFFLSARTERPLPALLFALLSGVLLGNLTATKWLGLGAVVLLWFWIGAGLLVRDRSRIPLPRIPLWLLPVAFLIVPVFVYLLWTIPLVGIPGTVRAAAGEGLFQTPCTFGQTPDPTVQVPTTWLGRVRHWHCTVWNYHAHLTATHPYGSPWWSWPLLKHPVLFYLDAAVTPPRRISATGNPVLWWTGFAVVWLTLLSLAIPRRYLPGLPVSRFLDFWLVSGVLGFWLPWIVIQRVAFHYHYFLSFTLTVILLALWLGRFLPRPKFRVAVFGFLLAAVAGFVYLYPSATAFSAFWLR